METTFDYLRAHAAELGARILETYPPLQSTKDPVAPAVATLLRKALPAQGLAITGTAKYLRQAKAARIVAECGAGKTFMALGTIHVLTAGQPSTTLVMCPSHITHKWAREVLLTVPRARTFLVEDMRNGGDPKKQHGICEVKLSKGKTVYEGKHLTLAEMRRMGRREWRKRFPGPVFFIIGKDKGKLGYFWDHAYLKAKSGPNLGSIVNPDSGLAILDSERQKLTHLDFDEKFKVSETLVSPKLGTTRFSALWQADRTRIQRMAPIEYIGRYMRGWFDFAIADELHQLAGDTAQGNGLGVLGRAAQRLIALTGTLMGGYADDLFNIFFRMEPRVMVAEGFAYGGQGRRDFQEQYGVLETVEKVKEADNACSRATKKTIHVLRKPGASPLLFGKFLMNTTAFLSLEDISDNLPRYDESVLSVDMDPGLQASYEQLEEDIRNAMQAHRGNKSLMSILLNTLLLYPDHPYGFKEIWARAFDPTTKEYEKFLVTTPENLAQDVLYAKEREVIADIREELRQGRRCQIYATFTGEKDVTLRLETVLRQAGIRVAVLRSSVPTDKREDWYDRQLKAGIEVVICHPKLVETGLDLLAFPTLYFYETGYSLHTLRQASRRSWRIGQRHPVKVRFVTYAGTMQETCLRLMGKKMLVALMMEGKFSGEGLQSLDADEDLMSSMARELVEKAGVGESADAIWRELDHEREKFQPPPVADALPDQRQEFQPEFQAETEDESIPTLDFATPPPAVFGIHLVEPDSEARKRKKKGALAQRGSGRTTQTVRVTWLPGEQFQRGHLFSASINRQRKVSLAAGLFFCVEKSMPKGPFVPSEFVATKFSTAADKADFGNAFLHFIESEWKETLFTKTFYNRLSNTFGHIAHYDQPTFYSTWFTSDGDRLRFLQQALEWPCWGDAEFTFCDVERALQREIRKRHYVAWYELKAAESLRAAELAILERLEAKYRPELTQRAEGPVDPVSATSSSATVLELSAPVQGSLF